jgi:tyrosinase
MARTRMDVWNRTRAEGDWPAVLTAYEVAVGKMRDLDPPSGRPVNPLGWRFWAAIHGLADSSGNPDTSNALWCNCQHGSWYFLPWHRMYIAAFERIIQHSLDDEEWALAYWYAIDPDDPGKAVVPPAFLDRTLNENNLQTEERSQTAKAAMPFYGSIDPEQVGETVIATLMAELFTTPTGQATFGGGERADFSFDGGERGSLENVPHGAVHSLVGNDYDDDGNVVDPGWMGSFYTAGLDPLFWLHHANIDRLWEVWRSLNPAHVNPTADPAFLDTTFTFPDPEAGSVTWSVGDVLDTGFLGYVYESVAAPSALGPPPPTPDEGPSQEQAQRTRSVTTEGSMPRSTPPEMLGATSDVSLTDPDPVRVPLGQSRRSRDLAPGEDDRPTGRVYLRVEGVTGTRSAPLYGVYVNVPEGADPREHPRLRAGSFSTFGLAETSQSNDQHDAEGLTAVFDITTVRDRLVAEDRWDAERVDVSFSTEVPGAVRRGGAATRERDVERARPDVRARRIAIMVD